MGFFDDCIKCKPPKRYPGCSANCPSYKKGKALLEKSKEAERKYKESRMLDKKYPNG